MKRTQQAHVCSRLRTQALVRSLTIQAPSDFRAHVLKRARALPCPSPLPSLPTAGPRGFWEACRLWLHGMYQACPRVLSLATGVGGLCVLALGSFLWHTAQQRDMCPFAPIPVVLMVEAPQPAGQAVEVFEDVVDVTKPQAPSPLLIPSPLDPTALLSPATEQALELHILSSLPALLPPDPDMSSTAFHATTQRSDTKRSTPGKARRTKKNGHLGKPSPA